MSSTYRTRNLFLKFLMATYLFAFTSIYLQIRGLYGTSGILPAHAVINLRDKTSIWEKITEQPTLLHFAPYLGLNVQYSMEFFALAGALFSFSGFLYQKICNGLTFFALWSFYISLYQVGQTFLHFQWDVMLLECGLIAVLVAPLSYSKPKIMTPKDQLSFWLVKWLFFRLMFASGVVKLTSQCPTWWGLTALTVHFESQCIPTPLAWYFHQLPLWFNKLSVVATFVIEIGLPFLFFSPFRSLRIFSCYAQVLLQILIIFTGNYNFFNLLTLVFCFSLIDDHHIFGKKSLHKSILERMAMGVVVVTILYTLLVWFGLDFARKDHPIYTEIKFTSREFNEALNIAVPVSIVIGVGSFVFTAISAIYAIAFQSKSSLVDFFKSAIQFVVYFFLIAFLFGVSLVSFSVLDFSTRSTLPAFLHRWNEQFNFKYHLSGSYGLFRSMTGVGGRPELILEGAAELDGPWTEIPFKYKPGSVDRPCPFIVPHQPRLDWQMWFAALSNYHQNPWVTSLAYRLLTNQTEVINLLDSNIYNEFDGEWPPKYIKGSLYTYHYTSPDYKVKENWWTREKTSDYLPIFSATHQPLIDYLVKYKIIRFTDIPVTNTTLISMLDAIWNYINVMEPHVFIWTIIVTVLVISRLK